MGIGYDKNKLSNAALAASGTDVRNANTSASASERSQALSESLSVGQAQTCCPNCQTVFEVAPELLTSSDTRVRCGECLSIFDSLSNLRIDDFPGDTDEDFLVDEDGNILNADSSYARATSGASDDFTASGDYSSAAGLTDTGGAASSDYAHDESMLDVTYSDFDLFSGEAGLPEVAYFDETQDSSGLRFDDTQADETFSDTLFSRDHTVQVATPPRRPESGSETLAQMSLDANVDFVTDDVPRDPLVFKYRDGVDELDAQAHAPVIPARRHDASALDTNRVTSSRSALASWAVRSLLVFLLVVIATGLYGYRNREALMYNSELRPWLASVCAVVGCQLPARVDLGSLKVVKRSVFSHPTIDNALVIDLAFVNGANFDQPYPVLEIRLTDRNGRLVVQNDVKPVDYLDGWQASDPLVAGERLDLSLTVADPGQTATSFELKFR